MFHCSTTADTAVRSSVATVSQRQSTVGLTFARLGSVTSVTRYWYRRRHRSLAPRGVYIPPREPNTLTLHKTVSTIINDSNGIAVYVDFFHVSPQFRSQSSFRSPAMSSSSTVDMFYVVLIKSSEKLLVAQPTTLLQLAWSNSQSRFF